VDLQKLKAAVGKAECKWKVTNSLKEAVEETDVLGNQQEYIRCDLRLHWELSTFIVTESERFASCLS
jgi:hypothetical protein